MIRHLARRLGLPALLRWYPRRLVMASFMFIGGFMAIGLLAVVAMISGTPLVFPSLGPTAFLFFFTPWAPEASPRNTIYGHAIAIVCGYGALCLTGLQHEPSAMLEGVHFWRVLAAALSLAATGSLMILLRVSHPPAAATTLIISLGMIAVPLHLLTIEVAVVLMTLLAIAVNWLAGIEYPLWAKHEFPRRE